ncbi:MAG: hydantoinase/oxoprolinase family protein [Hyphomicrobiaceae bacterium]
MAWRIGVDIGGTFADFCAFDEASGALHTLKVLTTPDEPGREIGEGLDILAARHGVRSAEIAAFVHGTTVGINTIIQRRGARLGLITTRGFEDVIELARLQMPDMYSLFCARGEQLVPRDRIFGVSERTLADGTVETPLDETELGEAVSEAMAKGCEGIVIAFLHSYRNPANERRALRHCRTLAPDLFAFASAEVWPVVREYERTTTAIMNGYVHPRVAGYITALEARLADRGVPAPAMLTKSNGGVMRASHGKRDCVGMLLSGTASGVTGAAYVAKAAGIANVLTLDVGGTSADVALIVDGNAQFGSSETIGDLPLNVPSVSVTSVGDGGGSIAMTDTFGVLRVGPESAGSTPGPACYGRGGTRATVTDAMVVAGLLGHAPLAYSSIALDAHRARAAVEPIAAALGLEPIAAADAIIEVAVSNMFVELNKLVARYGIDPADFTLMPFGGGGPMLGCFVAAEIGIRRVLVPLRPGVVSALGGLIADLKCDFIATVFRTLEPSAMADLAAEVRRLEADAVDWLVRQQRFEGEHRVTVSADMRYAGQSFEIEVDLERSWLDTGDATAIAEAFHKRHSAIYEFADPGSPVNIVNLRLVIAGLTAKPRLVDLEPASAPARPSRHVSAHMRGRPVEAALFDRAALRPGHTFSGPAIVTQEDTTTIVPPDATVTVDTLGNLLVDMGA